MRDISTLLWADLTTDEERLLFIESGRAYATGIMAKSIEKDIIDLLRFRISGTSSTVSLDNLEY